MDPSVHRQPPWSPGQKILNDTGPREPEHTFHQSVPITAPIVWADDGEEHLATVALGWTGRDVYVRTCARRAHEGGGHQRCGTPCLLRPAAARR